MHTTRREFLAGGAAAALTFARPVTPVHARPAERFRVFCTANPLPVPPGIADTAGDRYMADELGFERWAVCYHGSLNRIGVHVRDDGAYVDAPDHFDWKRDVDRADPDHAQHEWAIRQYARLCRGGANRYKRHLPATLPIMFDLEYGPWSMDVWNGPEPVKKLDAIMSRWLDVVRWAKHASGGLCPIGAYMLPVGYGGETERRLARQLDYAMPSLYMLEEYVPNPDLWFDVVDRTAATLDRLYPWLPKVAVVNPCWQIYRDADLQNRLGGKPIGLALWVRQLKHLIDRRWVAAFCWWGTTVLDEKTKPYLRELNALQR